MFQQRPGGVDLGGEHSAEALGCLVACEAVVEHAGAVDDGVDASVPGAYVVEHAGQCSGFTHVDRVIRGRAADRLQRRHRRGDLPRREDPGARRLDLGGGPQLADLHQHPPEGRAVRCAHRARVLRAGQRRASEQFQLASRLPGERDGGAGGDASGASGDHDDRLRVERHGRAVGDRRAVANAARGAAAVGVGHRRRPRWIHQLVGQDACGDAWRHTGGELDGADVTVREARARASASARPRPTRRSTSSPRPASWRVR